MASTSALDPPPAGQDVDGLLESLEGLAAGNIPPSLNDESKRLRLLEAARMASFRLERPWDTMQRLTFCALPPNIAQVGIDLGLWAALAERKSDDDAASVGELAREVGAEEALLARLLRYAATQGMAEQVGPDAYRATRITQYLAMAGMEALIFHVTERNIALYNAIPKWLADNGYKQPRDNRNLPFHLSQNTDLHFFEWLSRRPRHQKAFNEYMSFQRVGQKSWLDVFPLRQHVLDGEEDDGKGKDRIAFVDVGGGYGHQSREVLNRLPQLRGRIVLQDTHSAAIDSAKKELAGVTVVHHDFTTPQPVRGARVYYLRNILHDWPDEACRVILSQLRDAMAPDSVILLDELVIRDGGDAHWYGASFDLLMMANYGARERSLAEWDRILEAVGLERRNLVPYSPHGDAIQVISARAPVLERL